MIDSATFNNLKARVKAECARRQYTGSVASYAGAAYDYTNPAAAGKIVRYEHYTKIAEPLTAIDGKTRTPRSRINQADITEMQNALTSLEAIAVTSTSTGCSASCTGLCYSTCTGTCKGGCQGSCTGTCTGSCTGGCGYGCGGCDGSCWDNCWAQCAYYCTGGCTAGCADDCTTGCYLSCSGTCVVMCSTDCSNNCISECGALGY